MPYYSSGIIFFAQLPNVQFIRGRVGEAATLHAVLQELGDRKADVVLSDMAPACTGIRHDDHMNSVELCLYAADLMEQVSTRLVDKRGFFKPPLKTVTQHVGFFLLCLRRSWRLFRYCA